MVALCNPVAFNEFNCLEWRLESRRHRTDGSCILQDSNHHIKLWPKDLRVECGHRRNDLCEEGLLVMVGIGIVDGRDKGEDLSGEMG